MIRQLLIIHRLSNPSINATKIAIVLIAIVIHSRRFKGGLLLENSANFAEIRRTKRAFSFKTFIIVLPPFSPKATWVIILLRALSRFSLYFRLYFTLDNFQGSSTILLNHPYDLVLSFFVSFFLSNFTLFADSS